MSLQRCEGKNLESVLEEVRNRFGDTVTIVEANRLRKGGVGGFFAKERFEVVVDVDDDEHPPSAATEIPAEFGLAATEDFCDRLISLADGVSDLDETAPTPSAPSPPSATPSISTEQPEFSAVLESITRHMEAQAAPLPGPALAPAPAPMPPPEPARPAIPAGLAVAPRSVTPRASKPPSCSAHWKTSSGLRVASTAPQTMVGSRAS
ncbi:MAG TPA: hypothetical protein VJ622_02625, partial [Acidimicrobiia bacterium]|nr:hypothetical protein [Acidimicrobiia bacterium]